MNSTVSTTFTGLEGDFNFGHSGYVYLESDTVIPKLEFSSCQYYDVYQTTCNLTDKPPKTDDKVIVLRAWTALTLRDNILALLGYLMYQPTGTFTQDTNSALRILYEEIRRNNIKSMDLLPRMKTIAKTNQVSQVLALLKALQNLVPSFCHSAIDELGKTFTKRKDLLKNILVAHKGPGLFADIGLQMVPLLRIKNSKRNRDRDMEVAMGKEFAVLFTAIQDGRIVLTQPVLAVLMLNMRFEEFSAQSTEDFRLLCDILRLNQIPDWRPALNGPCCLNFKNPYDMVQAMLKIIVERPNIDPMIKTVVTTLLPQLVKIPTQNASAQRMHGFFGYSNFNISLFFDTLQEETMIPEVNSIRRLVDNGSINLAYALKGFVRYFYDTPRKLVIALMERIKYRVPMTDFIKIQIDRILAKLCGYTSKMTYIPNAQFEEGY